MSKSIFKWRGTLPIAAGFMLLPSLLWSQTEQQIKTIRKEIDFKNVNILSKRIKQNTLTSEQLMSRAKKLNIPFSGSVDGQYFQLKGFDKHTGNPLYYTTFNADAGRNVGVDKLRQDFGVFNLEGKDMRIHEWDGGAVLATHQEFGGRVTQKDKSTLNDHATHVAGTMVAAGVVPTAKGMAPQAFLDAYDWTDDENEMIEAAKNGALVSNHSYGYSGGFTRTNLAGTTGWHWLGADEDTEFYAYGKYSEFDREWDLLIQNFPYYLPVKAAGNPRGQGPEPGEEHFVRIENPVTKRLEWKTSTKIRQKNGGALGYDCLVFGALQKNLLTIGAANKIAGDYQNGNDVTMGSFSAFGPVDDGRIKPDIAGIGVGVYSPVSPGNKDYIAQNGTSMASPNVSGSLILLQEHYKNLNNNQFMLANTLKALALGTTNEAGAHPGPDYKSGWGLLNAYKAATTISVRNKYSLIEEKVLQNNATETIEVVASGNEPLRVTMVWTDPAPKNLPNANILNDRTKVLVNDLDIKVVKNGQTFYPWKLDPANPNNPATQGDNTVDNVEQILIENPEAGATYQIVISHKDTLKKNKFITNNQGQTEVDLEDTTEQKYSLVVTGINAGITKDVAINTIKVNVSSKQYSTQTPVIFQISNNGTEAISNAKLRYKIINKETNTEISSNEVEIGALSARQVLDKEILLDLSQSFIDYKIEGVVSVEGDQVDINNTASANAFGILANLTPKASSHHFGFEADFDKFGWTAEDADKDGKTWMKYDDAEISKKGESFAVNFPANNKGSNDWLFSNPIQLKANATYRVILNTRKFRSPEDYLQIFLGSEPKSSAMTKEIAKFSITGDDYTKHHYEFTSDTDQVAYIGFNNKVDANIATYALAIDEVTIQNASGVPFVDFVADKVKANSFEPIQLTSEVFSASHLPIRGYQWEFEPSNVSFQDGTSATSENPKVILNQEGIYKVTLKSHNDEGEGIAEKSAYITIENTATKALFTNAISKIVEGESITFTNGSTGNPAPTDFVWNITPSEGVEFIAGTSSTSKDAVIKFNKYGDYKIALTAKSVNNEDTMEKNISVTGLHEGVRNLRHSLENGNNLTLKWERPNMKDLYEEGFEAGTIPADMTVIDANNDNVTWGISRSYKNSGSYSTEGKSWTRTAGAIDADDWLVTPKLRRGAEILKYATRHQYNERYDVYVVEAPQSGKTPTLDELKAGTKVYSFEASQNSNTFSQREINIKAQTGKDFYLAFHHRTTKADNGYALFIDDILLGYDNTTTNSVPAPKIETQEVDYKALEQKGERILTDDKFGGTGKAQKSIIEQYGIATTPYVVGYKVNKDNSTMQNINDFNTKTYTENGLTTGTYTYDVYAVYSDGGESDKRSVVVEITNLSTSEVKDSGLKIYPNPSNGRFVVEAKSGVSSLKAEVYDMSGKLIFKNDFKGNKAEVNLTQYPKGVYILNLVDNNGDKHSAKLIIQ